MHVSQLSMMTSRTMMMMKKKVFRQGGPMWMFPFGLLFVLWSIPYNTIRVLWHFLSRVGSGLLVWKQDSPAELGLQQEGLLIFLHRHRLAMFACHFCGICTSFDCDQLAPRTFGCLANQRSCVHVMATAFPLWVCSLYLKEGGSPVWQGKLAIFRL